MSTRATSTGTDRRERQLAAAARHLAEQRLRAPARQANASRNARGECDRAERWRPARDRLWALADDLLEPGARVAVLGAGNCDDVPLTRLAHRAGHVALIDLDPRAPRRARRREGLRLRRTITVVEHDVTAGRADAICAAADAGQTTRPTEGPLPPLPGAPYDLVIGDLLYSQLIYPALSDLGLDRTTIQQTVGLQAPPLTRQIVRALHASAPAGRVIHLHDPVAWWPGHDQPFTLERALRIAEHDPQAAMRLARTGRGPHASDPRAALEALGLTTLGTRLWRWPFAPEVDYLVCATVSAGAPAPASR